ncbi:threonine synthase [Tepidibacter formicigenes]|uniref:Threonine synthase n=1 Tax=Tepidibacter formicigenes DSM 15518 TaxID=1123349 RepID=A0A1M6Q888_9FIRM|nr:threonine synthase [Tepidibacter formicigenes DSM 15518]
MWEGLINKYKKFLPVNKDSKAITLCEGNTPLIRASNLEKIMPGLEIYLKYEGLNPTGSFKDRGMTMAVTKAVEEGAKAIICASTGNTSASAAAFAAKAGIKCIVIVPDNKIALGKLAQAIAYGAKIIAIDGNFDDALHIVKEISNNHPITLVNSINPYRIEGQKTAAFEICDQLEESPDYVCIPIGNAGNISAYWKGFKEYKEKDNTNKLPRMLGFQAWGAAPIVENKVFENPETIATAIRIGNPASWDKAVKALDESNGIIEKISDDDIIKAYKMIANLEGVFAELASCISVAGLYKLYMQEKIDINKKVVCVLTGNGLKDPDTALKLDRNVKNIKCDINLIEREIVGDIL